MMKTQRDPLARLPSSRMPPDHLGVMIAAAIMIVLGWGGLLVLVITTTPRVGERWLFFLLLHIAVTGTVLPFIRLLNARFTPNTYTLPPGGVLVRQGVWVGLFAVACAWLQIPRALSPQIAFLLALAFIVIEIFLRARELPNERYED